MVPLLLLTVGVPLREVDGAHTLAARAMAAPASPPPETMRDYAALGSHDAATGYIGDQDLLRVAIKTQCGDFPTQASCGARVFDLRLGTCGGTSEVKMHHAQLFATGQTVKHEMARMVDWAKAHPSELVVFAGSHCTRCSSPCVFDNVAGLYPGECVEEDCNQAKYIKVFEDNGIHVMTDVDKFHTLPLAEAKNISTLPGGKGMILATLDTGTDADRDLKHMFDDTYSSCSDIGWCPEKPQESWDELDDYFDDYLNQTKTYPWFLQAMWQEGPSNPYIWDLNPHGANWSCFPMLMPVSIAGYTRSSRVNEHVLERLKAGAMSSGATVKYSPNVLLMNYVSNLGPDIAAALGATVTVDDREQCLAAANCAG